jgi:hypothetical protein
MIARSALPSTARNILDRVDHRAIGAWLYRYVRLLRRASKLPPTDRGSRISSSRRQRMAAVFGDWTSLSEMGSRGEPPAHDRTDRFRRFCRDCGEDTTHEGFDEFGLGWYAQICSCRRCGRQGIQIWPLPCW